MKKSFIASGPCRFSHGVDLLPSMNQKCTDYSPFITLCLWTTGIYRVISESCYNRTILQRNNRKMTLKLSYSYNSVVYSMLKNWEPRYDRVISKSML